LHKAVKPTNTTRNSSASGNYADSGIPEV